MASTPCSTPEARQRVRPESLLHFTSNVYSQRGDDGIIREVFRRLNVSRGFFIEFGAWDGIYLSNARLLYEKGWSGLFIEADDRKYKDLVRNYASRDSIRCIQSVVAPTPREGAKTLDEICDELGIGNHFEFLSIDIDGLDLNIFEHLRRRPLLLCIEGGFSWHPEMNQRVPDEVAAQNLQQPLSVAISAVRAKGYEPICFNQNLYAVERAAATQFEGGQDALHLWLDAYWDQSESFRTELRQFRSTNKLIVQHEKEFRSAFQIQDL